MGCSASYSDGHDDALGGRPRCPLRTLTDPEYVDGYNAVVKYNLARENADGRRRRRGRRRKSARRR